MTPPMTTETTEELRVRLEGAIAEAARLGIDVMDIEALERWRAGPSALGDPHDMAANWNSVRRLVALIDLLALSPPPAAGREEIARIDVKAIWKAHGGAQHGPHVEQYYIEEQAFYRFAKAYADAILALKPPHCVGGVEGLTIPPLDPPRAEDHPLLAPILEKRLRSAANFSPEFSGQRGEDFDRGLMCAFEAVNGQLQRMTNALKETDNG